MPAVGGELEVAGLGALELEHPVVHGEAVLAKLGGENGVGDEELGEHDHLGHIVILPTVSCEDAVEVVGAGPRDGDDLHELGALVDNVGLLAVVCGETLHAGCRPGRTGPHSRGERLCRGT